jgi:AcrR family transcriptional regulator
MPTVKKTQAQRREETRQNVLNSACKIFGAKGFERTALEDIAQDAGMTISPIYHYFNNKLELFTEVTEFMEDILISKIRVFHNQDNELPLQQGWDDFLKLCQDKNFVQIVLLDAPHILGRERWHQSKVVSQFYRIIDNSKLFNAPTMPLLEHDKELILRMLTAAFAEAALMLANNPEYDSSTIIQHFISMLEH